MNVYVFQQLDPLTDSYHSNGGAVAIAESLDEAKAMIQAEADEQRKSERTHTPIDWEFAIYRDDDGAIEMDYSTPAVIPCDQEATKRVFIFPNAGCC